MKKKTDKITIFDVAREAQVSKSTVSLVLTHSDKVSDKSKEKVLHAIDKLGYVYNRDAAALRSRRSNLVALVINDLTNPYSAQIAVGLENHIHTLGMLPMLVNTAESVERQTQVVKTLKEYNVAAFIMCPAPGTTQQWVDELINSGFPVIHIMREVPFCAAPTILPDNKKGTHLATSHILQQGIEDIAFIGGTNDISDHHERLSGFHSALKQFNIHQDKPTITAATNRQGGRDAFATLYAQYPATKAIICFNDVIAYGVVEAIRQHGLIPGKDIKVVGFDDLADSCLMSPSLSSVTINADDIGKHTCQVLQELLNQGTPAVRTLVDVHLQVRASSQ
ncbi:MAG: LacI family transcriptional regulator [Pseudoalteromonas rhizosphaerae]|jgi:LacI family transcriptional regulator|uniref:Substrate-binding domain-containing protein n=1 Tax=Pseudoalteromonas neustonica TaxID=1840331 RepID=A0ABY3FH59_9GAMM|nr:MULTISPECIES: LacI family DNA-binding transcriptional regulator [Pseudoalteromonas]MBB1300297.1 LacI family DNA-binding transcriptional regulator [Pseudoalteromonas sp. SR44-8]MBB1309300.1 LacI family DNA-binding transcriptional regulator [Pseudoalteromonas sp. SR41-8]MBB1407990.1 LacI family DNA-binding transcriptional regulator [Pseudoalteromonas sp. SG44-17]MBB1504324.1 LacI family DNA-binding transcriptional regulator [Pseudoalteromonas sp. SG41-1]TVU85432.1 substrate-binding domain-con|tara:strand:+ start:2765 stop:3772 length:1008 start_codon:yes stop_codon:yes gene_type:complete